MASSSPKLCRMNLNGRVTAMCVSDDFSTFAISLEEETVAKLLVFSLDIDIEKEKTTFNSRYLPSELCISHVSEIVGALSILQEQIHIQTFDVKDGINNSFGNIITEKIPQFWQISFCPADESVMCALGGGTVYLLRTNTGHIENFSTIFLPDVVCHDWGNDVNIIFGSQSGLLHIYRETISLDIVDIKTLAGSVLSNAVNTGIIAICSTTRRFACQTSSGVILIFDSNVESGPLWDSNRAYIVPNFTLKTFHTLCFDFSDETLLYDNGSSLQMFSIQYLSKLDTFNGDVVAFRHCCKIQELKSTDTTIITLDQNGFIGVFSKFTNRVLCSSQIPNAVFFTVVANSHHLLVVTDQNVSSYTITLDGLKIDEVVFEKPLIMAVDSYDMSILAILYETGFIAFRTGDRSILMSEETTEKKHTKQMIISKDNKYLIFLMNNDSVICMDISTKKTLWASDFKLHFFQSMAYCNATLLLLNQKFIVSRIKHGKPLPNVNMHASDIGFSITSELIAGNDDFVFVTTELGELLCALVVSFDEPVVIKTKFFNSKITKIRTCKDELLIGYQNGSVGWLKYDDSEIINENVDDVVLCSFNEVAHLKSLLRDLNSERNSIKQSTEQFLSLFMEQSNTELTQIKKEFDETIRTCKTKVGKFESDFQEAEVLKTKTISNLKNLYENENLNQKKKYEAMLEDQIRKSFRQMNDKDIEVQSIKQIAEKKHRETIDSFHQIEKQFEKQRLIYLSEIDNNKRTIVELKNQLKEIHERTEVLEINHVRNTQKLKKIHKEDSELLEAEIWSLKGTCVQLDEKKQLLETEIFKIKNKFKIAQQQTQRLFEDNKESEIKIRDLNLSIDKLQHDRSENKKNFAKLNSKFKLQEKIQSETLAKNHCLKRRMQDLEAKINELSRHVYNPRKLEHAVLSLLASSQNTDLDKRYGTMF